MQFCPTLDHALICEINFAVAEGRLDSVYGSIMDSVGSCAFAGVAAVRTGVLLGLRHAADGGVGVSRADGGDHRKV